MTPDSNGRISIRIPHPDPDGATVDFADVLVVVTVELGGGAEAGLTITDVAHPQGGPSNEVRTVPVMSNGNNLAVAWAGAVFSDDARAASTYTISTRNWGRFSSTGNPNEVTLTLLDQYGDTYSGTAATRYLEVHPHYHRGHTGARECDQQRQSPNRLYEPGRTHTVSCWTAAIRVDYH